jgi:hypothetical protein
VLIRTVRIGEAGRRVTALAGLLKIESPAGGGTLVVATLSLSAS